MNLEQDAISSSASALPRSLAIAGGWGYIGRKFIDAALQLEIPTSVYDPGPMPGDVDPRRIQWFDDENAFFHSDADMFHLATQPQHRTRGLSILLARPAQQFPLILNEKPMAAPEVPEECVRIEQAVADAGATMLFDFPELYDELTERILDYLGQFSSVKITEAVLTRSKDREDPAIARNFKPMFPIQYQESVHCLAFLLYVLGRLRGSVDEVLDMGISVKAESDVYQPPNPDAYSHPVDGRCQFQLSVGSCRVRGDTNFKRGAPWAKRRELRGIADGRPFEIIVDYLEGQKRLTVNGAAQAIDPKASTYEQVLRQAWHWHRHVGRAAIDDGVYPTPRFARVVFQLASVLWRSSQDKSRHVLRSATDVLRFDAAFDARYTAS